MANRPTEKNWFDYCTSDGSVECKSQCPCSIVAVLAIYIGPVLIYIKGGGVLVGFVKSIVLIAILGGKSGVSLV